MPTSGALEKLEYMHLPIYQFLDKQYVLVSISDSKNVLQ